MLPESRPRLISTGDPPGARRRREVGLAASGGAGERGAVVTMACGRAWALQLTI